MRIWSSVRTKENFLSAEREIEKWEWVMNQKYLELINKKIILVEKKRFNNNKDLDLMAIPDLRMNLDDFDLNNVEENVNDNPMKISNLLNQELNS